MKVVICGAGQVGFNIARYLSMENNDVTVIDQSPELIGKINDSLDVQAFVGKCYRDQHIGISRASTLQRIRLRRMPNEGLYV